jgi:hypothetical protein
MRRLQRSIGRTVSRVPCVTKILGFPCSAAGAAKPGENATMCMNRSPFVSPSERAYDAPSEKPPIAMRRGSGLTRANVQSRAISMYETSGPYPAYSTSQLAARDSGASTTSPAPSARDSKRVTPCSPRPPAPCSMTASGAGAPAESRGMWMSASRPRPRPRRCSPGVISSRVCTSPGLDARLPSCDASNPLDGRLPNRDDTGESEAVRG